MSPILKDKKHKENAIADNKLTKDENGLYKDVRIGVGIGMNQTEISGVGVINTNGINRYSTSLMIKIEMVDGKLFMLMELELKILLMVLKENRL